LGIAETLVESNARAADTKEKVENMLWVLARLRWEVEMGGVEPG
jgi:hypothetical protein